jgi:ankyrin repeat protein
MKYLSIFGVAFIALFISGCYLFAGEKAEKKVLPRRYPVNIKNNLKKDPTVITKKTVAIPVESTKSVDDFLKSKDILGRTPLMVALANKQTEIYTAILKTEVDVNVADISGETPLHLATAWGLADVVETLITLGANVNASDKFGQTALIIAIKLGNKQIIKLLKNANVTIPTTLQAKVDKLLS